MKINSWLATALLAVMLVSMYGWWGSCNKKSEQEKVFAELEKSFDKTLTTIQGTANDFKDSLEIMNWQLAVSQKQTAGTQIELDAANDRITQLLQKHAPVKPNSDTNITSVPNEYIADCTDCFTELKNGQLLVKRALAEKDKFEAGYKGKITLQENRITKLGEEYKQLQLTLKDAIEAGKKQEKKIEPRRTLYFSMNTISFGSAVPNGVGIGLIYQDKKRRIFQLNGFGTNQGLVYTGGLSFPLTFRNK